MTEHILKCWPEHYAAIDCGAKTCELRLNDRPYTSGDALLLQEWEPVENGYTGREMRVRVTHILNGGPWLSPGYIAMSIRLMGEDGRVRLNEDWKGIADRHRETIAELERNCVILRQQLAEANEARGIAEMEREGLRRELAELRAALIRWHESDETPDFCDADERLAEIAAELADDPIKALAGAIEATARAAGEGAG